MKWWVTTFPVSPSPFIQYHQTSNKDWLASEITSNACFSTLDMGFLTSRNLVIAWKGQRRYNHQKQQTSHALRLWHSHHSSVYEEKPTIPCPAPPDFHGCHKLCTSRTKKSARLKTHLHAGNSVSSTWSKFTKIWPIKPVCQAHDLKRT
jgi:hypothetical protein